MLLNIISRVSPYLYHPVSFYKILLRIFFNFFKNYFYFPICNIKKILFISGIEILKITLIFLKKNKPKILLSISEINALEKRIPLKYYSSRKFQWLGDSSRRPLLLKARALTTALLDINQHLKSNFDQSNYLLIMKFDIVKQLPILILLNLN